MAVSTAKRTKPDLFIWVPVPLTGFFILPKLLSVVGEAQIDAALGFDV